MGLVTGIVLIVVGVLVIVSWAFGRGVVNGAKAAKDYLRDKYEDLRS